MVFETLGDLYLVDPSKVVFTFSPTVGSSGAVGERQEWRFSRMSPMQHNKVVFILRCSPETGWAIHDYSPGKRGVVFGTPRPLAPGEVDIHSEPSEPSEFPPLGRWTVWGASFVLTEIKPYFPPCEQPFTFEKPFATLKYSEDGNVGKCDVTMHGAPITDADLEDMLRCVKSVLQNLARRPGMIVVFRSDARKATVPAMRHVWRFTSFIQEFGSEFFLVGRGNAFVFKPSGVFGSAVMGVVKMVQKILPAPWPEAILPTMEAAERFLVDLVQLEVECHGAADVPTKPAPTAVECHVAADVPTEPAPTAAGLFEDAAPVVESVAQIDTVDADVQADTVRQLELLEEASPSVETVAQVDAVDADVGESPPHLVALAQPMVKTASTASLCSDTIPITKEEGLLDSALVSPSFGFAGFGGFGLCGCACKKPEEAAQVVQEQR